MAMTLQSLLLFQVDNISRLKTDWIDITEEPLDAGEVHNFLYRSEGGGVCVFAGTTRRITGDKSTEYLSYESHISMALKEMQALSKKAREQWPILRTVLLHRIGDVKVGEPSVLIGVASAHRGPAFEAARFLIDELKKSVQIWKQEHYTNKTTEWVQTDWPAE
jgi:molybdopterin synthase catalytic subunit